MPLRFVIVGLLLVGLAVVGRRPLIAAVKSATAGAVDHVRAAGPVHLAALGGILVAGVLLRLDYLHEPMRWDESYNFVQYGRLRFDEALAYWDSPNNHAFHTALMNVSYKLFGQGEAALRAPVFMAGVIVPAMAYVAAARLYDRRVAIVVAALCAASPQLVEFSTNARGYEVATLFAVTLVALAPSMLRSTNPVAWVLFALTAALGLYTVSVFAYPFAVIGATLGVAALLGATDQPKVGFLLRLAATGAAAVALAAIFYGPILSDVWEYLQVGSYAEDGWEYVKETWELWTLGLPDVVAWVLLAGFLASAVTLGRRRTGVFPLAASLLALIVVSLLLGRVVPLTRVFLPLLPLFLIGAVGGLLAALPPVARALAGRRADIATSVAALAIAIALGLHVADDRLANDDSSALPSAGAIAQWAKATVRQEDQVVITASADPIIKYEFVRYGLPPGWVFTALSPEVAADGVTYVIVNERAGESLQDVRDESLVQAELPEKGKVVATYPGATIYALRR